MIRCAISRPSLRPQKSFLAIAVAEGLKVGSLKELAALATSRPTRLNWAATPGLPYFALAGLQKRAGWDFLSMVPYRDFNQAVADLGEGRIDLVAAGISPLLPHTPDRKDQTTRRYKSRARCHCPKHSDARRSRFADLTFSPVTGFFGSHDMPNELRERVAADIRAIADEPSIKERLTKMELSHEVALPRSSRPLSTRNVHEWRRLLSSIGVQQR